MTPIAGCSSQWPNGLLTLDPFPPSARHHKKMVVYDVCRAIYSGMLLVASHASCQLEIEAIVSDRISEPTQQQKEVTEVSASTEGAVRLFVCPLTASGPLELGPMRLKYGDR